MESVRGRGRRPLWIQRMRAAETLAGALGQENHPLIAEAYRKCMEDLLDVPGATEILRRVQSDDIRLVTVRHTAPSPMALPLRHLPGRVFVCVPGTAVVLRGGLPVCLLERQGASLWRTIPKRSPALPNRSGNAAYFRRRPASA